MSINISSFPFVIDKTFNSYTALINSNDDVMVGRYVIIKYCDEALGYRLRTEIRNRMIYNTTTGNTPTHYATGTQEKIYYDNYYNDNIELADSKNWKSYDRYVFQKIKVGTNAYEPVCCLHAIDEGSLDDIAQLSITRAGNNTSLIFNDLVNSTIATNVDYANVFGGSNSVTKSGGFVAGSNNTVRNALSTVFGYNNISGYDNQFIIGQFNAPNNGRIKFTSSTYPLFIIGTGSNSDSRHSSLMYTINGGLLHLTNSTTTSGSTVSLAELSIVHGHLSGNYPTGIAGISLGNNSRANGNYSLAHGLQNTTTVAHSAVFGKYNEPKTNILFSVGCGTAADNKRNAIEITSSGLISAPQINAEFIEDNDKALVTSDYVQSLRVQVGKIKILTETEDKRTNADLPNGITIDIIGQLRSYIITHNLISSMPNILNVEWRYSMEETGRIEFSSPDYGMLIYEPDDI